jgi:N-formylglutamate amidohydrolase
MWAVHRTGPGSSPLIIHVPHAGTWIPDDERRLLLLDDDELDLELRRMTDWHTDRMAADALALAGDGVAATVFANRTSRLVVDPERFVDDTEPMAAIGMGAVYRVTSHLHPLRRPDPGEERRLLDRWFHPYAAAFTRVVDEALADHGEAVIVDLHSFPSIALPYEPDPSAVRPAICVGTDPVHTSSRLAVAAQAAFGGVAGGVANDSPFAGTYVPLAHWRRTPEVRSIMIEVRRDLYQSEPGGPLHNGYDPVMRRLAYFLSQSV